MRTFPLWGFDDGQTIVITRGETREQAWEYAQRNFRRGVGLPAWNTFRSILRPYTTKITPLVGCTGPCTERGFKNVHSTGFHQNDA